MSEPLPKELVRDAWKARVGYSVESVRTHRAFSECQLCVRKEHAILCRGMYEP
jgi:hypothetical protein